MWDAARAVFGNKWTLLNAYIRKETLKISDLSFHIKKLEKGEKIKTSKLKKENSKLKKENSKHKTENQWNGKRQRVKRLELGFFKRLIKLINP